MKILMVITRGDTMGGAQMHLETLAQWLLSRNLEIFVVSGGNGNGILLRRLFAMNIPCLALPSLKHQISLLADLTAFLKLAILVFRFQPDIVCAHSFKAASLVRLLSIFGLIRCSCITAHGWSHIRAANGKLARHLYIFIEQILNIGSDAVITVSYSDAHYSRALALAPPHKTFTIHNGCVDYAASLACRNRPELSMLNFVSIMRFEYPKDPVTVIKALFALRELPWHFTFIGDGPELNSCISLVEEYQLSSRITFLGFLDDARLLLSSYDVFVLSSLSEGLPVSIIESLCCGLPIVASDVGGVSELVKSSLNGMLFRSGCVPELSKALSSFILDPGLLHLYGLSSRKLYVDYFSSNAMCEATFSLYQKICPSNN